MAYGLSNDHVTDDVTWPWKVKLVTPIRLERNIPKTAGDIGTPLQRTTNRKWYYGVSNSHVTDDVTWPQRCCEAVRSAILATAWLLVNCSNSDQSEQFWPWLQHLLHTIETGFWTTCISRPVPIAILFISQRLLLDARLIQSLRLASDNISLV